MRTHIIGCSFIRITPFRTVILNCCRGLLDFIQFFNFFQNVLSKLMLCFFLFIKVVTLYYKSKIFHLFLKSSDFTVLSQPHFHLILGSHRNPSTAFYQAFHLNTFQESKNLWDRYEYLTYGMHTCKSVCMNCFALYWFLIIKPKLYVSIEGGITWYLAWDKAAK